MQFSSGCSSGNLGGLRLITGAAHPSPPLLFGNSLAPSAWALWWLMTQRARLQGRPLADLFTLAARLSRSGHSRRAASVQGLAERRLQRTPKSMGFEDDG